MKENPFAEQKKIEVTQQQRKVRALQAANETMELARSCINTTQFQAYKEMYKQTREQIFDICEDLKSSDPLTYAFEMADYMARLRMLGVLLKKVETEARSE